MFSQIRPPGRLRSTHTTRAFRQVAGLVSGIDIRFGTIKVPTDLCTSMRLLIITICLAR